MIDVFIREKGGRPGHRHRRPCTDGGRGESEAAPIWWEKLGQRQGADSPSEERSPADALI